MGVDYREMRRVGVENRTFYIKFNKFCEVVILGNSLQIHKICT